MQKYGHHAYLSGIVRPDAEEGHQEFTFLHLDGLGRFAAIAVRVAKKHLRGGRLKVTVMDRKHSAKHTQVMLSEDHAHLVAVVPDEHLKIRAIASLLTRRKKRARLSEVTRG